MIGGMHRSGTSWLARTLALCGLDLGERACWSAPDNPLGFWEDRLFVELNDFFLGAQGGTWDNPPKTKMKFEGILVNVLVCDKTEPIGLKDPRVSLLVDCWKAVFTNMVLVAPIRHPMEVAQSLHVRNGFDLEKGLELWRHYNTELIAHGCRFVGFPSQLGIQTLVDDLGLIWTDEAREWMDASAVHHCCMNAPKKYEALYVDILNTIEA